MLTPTHFALAVLLGLTACTVAREGSTVVSINGSARTNTPVIVTAAANGANAQNAGNRSDLGARGQAATSFASRWWVWLLAGVALAALFWFLKTFIFTGARLALLK
jgi:hypothetical protein